MADKVMRLNVDVPEPFFRRVKVLAALEGCTLKELVIRALEKQMTAMNGLHPRRRKS